MRRRLTTQPIEINCENSKLTLKFVSKKIAPTLRKVTKAAFSRLNGRFFQSLIMFGEKEYRSSHLIYCHSWSILLREPRVEWKVWRFKWLFWWTFWDRRLFSYVRILPFCFPAYACGVKTRQIINGTDWECSAALTVNNRLLMIGQPKPL